MSLISCFPLFSKKKKLVVLFTILKCADTHANKIPLDWNIRMKIAAGTAKGLEYLHDRIKPPIIYRDLKCSNILLGKGYHPKLSDFGLAKVGPSGDQTHVSTRVMGTYGYCAPEYAMTGKLTFKSDIYSFGVVLLEIITGRKAIDNTRTDAEQNLVAWVRYFVYYLLQMKEVFISVSCLLFYFSVQPWKEIACIRTERGPFLLQLKAVEAPMTDFRHFKEASKDQSRVGNLECGIGTGGPTLGAYDCFYFRSLC